MSNLDTLIKRYHRVMRLRQIALKDLNMYKYYQAVRLTQKITYQLNVLTRLNYN